MGDSPRTSAILRRQKSTGGSYCKLRRSGNARISGMPEGDVAAGLAISDPAAAGGFCAFARLKGFRMDIPDSFDPESVGEQSGAQFSRRNFGRTVFPNSDPRYAA